MGMLFSSSDPDELKGWIPPGATEEFRKSLREREAQEARDREVAQKKMEMFNQKLKRMCAKMEEAEPVNVLVQNLKSCC